MLTFCDRPFFPRASLVHVTETSRVGDPIIGVPHTIINLVTAVSISYKQGICVEAITKKLYNKSHEGEIAASF